MKKFVLTSPKLQGQVTFGYNDDGFLIFFHNEAEMNREQHQWMLNNNPGLQQNITILAQIIQGRLEELPEDLSFDRFWVDYGKKINKARCIPLYNKLKDADKMLCLRGIRPYDRYLNRNPWRGKADPETYLKKRMFETDWDKER